jgi:hypothetical protein
MSSHYNNSLTLQESKSTGIIDDGCTYLFTDIFTVSGLIDTKRLLFVAEIALLA